MDLPDETTKELGHYLYQLVLEKDGIETPILGGRILVEAPPPRFTQADVDSLREIARDVEFKPRGEPFNAATENLADRIASSLSWFSWRDVDLLEREAANAGASDFNGAAERPLKDLARRIAAVLPEDGDSGSR